MSGSPSVCWYFFLQIDILFATGLEIELAGATDYDRFSIGGNGQVILVTQGNNLPQLDVSLLGGFVPDATDVFSVFNFDLLVGEFGNAPNGGTLLTMRSDEGSTPLAIGKPFEWQCYSSGRSSVQIDIVGGPSWLVD